MRRDSTPSCGHATRSEDVRNTVLHPPPTHSRRLLVAAALAPLLTHLMALGASVEPGAWLTVAAPVRWSLAPDAVLFTAVFAIVFGPIVGAVVSNAGGRPATLAAAATSFTVVSALLTLAWRFDQTGAVNYALRSHVPLLAVALALSAWGAVCGAWLRNPLDAAGVSLLAALVASGGLLVGGAAVGDLPRPLIAAGLAANPLVAVAIAAHIDIFRTDVLYQISPLAHMQIDYPTWPGTTAAFVAVAAMCWGTLSLAGRRTPRAFHYVKGSHP